METRLGDARATANRVYGTLPATFDFNAVIERAFAG
jgi:putative acyl-CoA dehydrogenase